jgi:hypothetical protein
MAANASILCRGSREAFHAERAWQARWIAHRAGLPEAESA